VSRPPSGAHLERGWPRLVHRLVPPVAPPLATALLALHLLHTGYSPAHSGPSSYLHFPHVILVVENLDSKNARQCSVVEHLLILCIRPLEKPVVLLLLLRPSSFVLRPSGRILAAVHSVVVVRRRRGAL
jgi:hypothetical protein